MKTLKRVIVKPYEKDRFELVEEFKIEDLKLLETTLSFSIPAGFKTDGASVPRVFWSLFPPFRSEYFTAVLVHDYLCLQALTFKQYKIADEALKVMMILLGCSKMKGWIFYSSCLSFHAVKCGLLWCKESLKNALA